jgi:ribosomal protein S18 acetylase RimI-like enzyme
MASMVAGKRWLAAMRSSSPLPKNLILREFHFPADYAQVIQLWENVGPGIHLNRSDAEGEIVKKIQRDPDLFLVAEENGQIIGTVMGGFDGRRGMVYHLAVSIPYHNKGIGKILMAELEQRMQARGCLRSYLLVTRDNEDAIHFYESHGWERMDLLVYGKDLE